MEKDQRRITGQELRRFLGSHSMTHEDLARKLDIARETVSRWVTGKRSPETAFHLAVRYLMGNLMGPQGQILVSKKVSGAPVKKYRGFDRAKAPCPHPDCKRTGDKLMYPDKGKVPHDHILLGKILSLFCDGTHSHKHKRVTLTLDRQGRLWNISDWPQHRKKLAPFELRAVRSARAAMGRKQDEARLLQALQRCTTSLDGKLGCGGTLTYDGHYSRSKGEIRRLHAFYCRNSACGLEWHRRFFDAAGREIRLPKSGGARVFSKLPVPPNARLCPVCHEPLGLPREISDIGGDHYDPPLLRLWCKNKGADHGPARRKELSLPAGSRQGFTFYYDRKNSRFTEITHRAFRKDAPVKRCNEHGRMRTVTHKNKTQLKRIPQDIREKMADYIASVQAPVIYKAYCRFHPEREIWIAGDGQLEFQRTRSASVHVLQTSTKLVSDSALG